MHDPTKGPKVIAYIYIINSEPNDVIRIEGDIKRISTWTKGARRTSHECVWTLGDVRLVQLERRFQRARAPPNLSFFIYDIIFRYISLCKGVELKTEPDGRVFPSSDRFVLLFQEMVLTQSHNS